MNLPEKAVARLNAGHDLAAQLPAFQEGMLRFIMVIPKTPSKHDHPEAWTGGTYHLDVLRDAASIMGYEIRYVSHDQKYTDTEWGMDYDYVLDDETTRIKRVFVQKQEEIAPALTAWTTEFDNLRDTGVFDSSLLTSPIDAYLDRPDERPHLWQPDFLP